MIRQGELPLHEYDLPPKWDGQPIEWEASWNPPAPAFICPPPKPQPCSGCGRHTLDQPHKMGRTRAVQDRGPVVLMLSVHRCPSCRLDTVFELETGQCWTLDVTDYGPQGSRA
jgi:hypothetical protein